MKSTLKDIQQALMTGVSYKIPVVVAGGILVALGFLLGGYNVPNDVAQGETFASTIFWSGKIGLDTRWLTGRVLLLDCSADIWLWIHGEQQAIRQDSSELLSPVSLQVTL